MKFVPDLYSVRNLVGLVDDGHLAIPEFQRRFIWRPPEVADLLVSVARRWPIGSLLLLEGPQDFAARSLEGGPELTSSDLLLLDGQQRVTALYLALGDRSTDEVYVIDFAALRRDGELGDEHIRAHRRRTFEKQFPDSEHRAKAGLLTVAEAADTARFADWAALLPEDLKDGAFAVRDDLLGGLQEYSVPAVRLPREIELGALAKIFETINRTGVRLRPFDLMVARLYPHDFRLYDEWNAAREAHPIFGRFETDGLEILRLIALRVAVEARREGVADGPQGIRGGDVLGLSPSAVRDYWDWAVDTYAATLDFVQEECGVRSQALLPSATMLLPLGLVLSEPGDTAQVATRFFWAATLTQAYQHGANTQAVRDARDLIAEVRDDAEPPETVRLFSPDETLLDDVRRRNESLLRGLMCLLIVDGAEDWFEDAELKDLFDVEIARVFSEEYLRPRGISPDALVNFTPLSRASSRELARLTPEELPGRVPANRLERQGIPSDPEVLSAWSAFFDSRRRFWLERLQRLAKDLRD